MDKNLKRKLKKLRKKIRSLDSAAVAFSGGVDSSLVMRICREELGENAVAVTTLSKDYPSSELAIARRVAKIMGVRHVTHDPSEDSDEDRPNRYSSLKSFAMRLKCRNVLDGSHKDDEEEGRARFRAARKAGVISPLLESGLSKAEIRMLSKELGLPNWDMQSSSSRKDALQKFTKYLARIGVKNTVVKQKGKKVYVTSNKTGLRKLLKNIDKIKKKAASLGFAGVLLGTD